MNNYAYGYVLTMSHDFVVVCEKETKRKKKRTKLAKASVRANVI
jgi:hypothetical protein